MTMKEPLQPRRRIREFRKEMRAAERFDHDSDLHDKAIAFLDDLVWYLAPTMLGDDEASAFLFRCMGAMAHANADRAYEPHGYVNPFAFPAHDGLSEVPAPVAWPPARLAPEWTWPVINQPPPASDGAFGVGFRAFSALKMFGYTVGKTDGWSEPKRQKFLSDFMEMELPAEVKKVFGDEYGEPMTTTRLRKVANVIASNASNFARNDAAIYRHAIADWKTDLDFLEREYYEGAGLKFYPWPSSRPD